MAGYNLTTDDIFITTLVDKWFTSKEVVNQLDEDMKIESLGKTKLLNQLFADANPGMENNKPNNELAVTVRTYFENHGIEDETFVGLYETMRRLLREFDDRVDKYTDANVKTVPDSEKPSEADLEKMRKDRKKAVDNMNGIRTLLEGTAPDWFKDEGNALLPLEKNLRGALGNREPMGKRLGATFTFTVIEGDNEHALQGKNLSALKEYLKAESVSEIRKLIEAANEGFVWETPPDKFSFSYKGKTVVALKNVDDSPEEDEDSEEEEDLDIITNVGESGPELFDDDDED